jgi:hypothetical protein
MTPPARDIIRTAPGDAAARKSLPHLLYLLVAGLADLG